MTGERTRRGEFQLIAELFAPLSKGAAGALGLKDDVALIDVSPGCQLVTTTDTLISGVHFRAGDPPETVARKALRVNLSDLAAKGARPVGFLQALSLNDSIDDAYLERYAAGLAVDVQEFGVALLGGDTISGPGPLAITITAFGEVETGKALLRSGARPGDIVCVTGTIGDGAVGLACLNSALQLPAPLTEYAVDRYHIPQPRLTIGRALAGLATACLDVSDGLVADVGHLCEASGVAIVLDRDSIPLSPAVLAAVEWDAGWWDAVLGGGDDYELAFTLPPEWVPTLETLAAKLKFPLTVIGTVIGPLSAPGLGVTVTSGGKPVPVTRAGYRHR